MTKYSKENMFSREAIGRRMRTIRGEMTCQAFGERLGVSAGFVSEIEHGRKKPSAEMLFALAMRLGVDVTWILRGDAPASRAAETPPRYGATRPGGSAEIPVYRLDHRLLVTSETLALPAPFAKPHLIAVHMTEDGMAPTIPVGSLVGIDQRAKTVKAGEIYLVTVKEGGGERFLIRRVYTTGGFRLRADNERHAEVIVPRRGVRVLGAVVWILRPEGRPIGA